MKLRVTNARTFAVEFEAETPKQFKLGVKKALLEIDTKKHPFLEVQFRDIDGAWRLSKGRKFMRNFNPVRDTDYDDEWFFINHSYQKLIELTGFCRVVAHGEKPDLEIVKNNK